MKYLLIPVLAVVAGSTAFAASAEAGARPAHHAATHKAKHVHHADHAKTTDGTETPAKP